jgi:hypothetical protein
MVGVAEAEDPYMEIAGMPPKDLLTILLSAITASITAYNWRVTRFRTKLKDDLEILSYPERVET